MVANLFARPVRPFRRAPRLGVVELERRDVPALYWTGAESNDARDPDNWWHGDTAYDPTNLFFVVRPASFMQPAFGQRECVGLTGSYNSITVAEGFDHRIVLGANPEEFVPNDPDPSTAPEPVAAEDGVSVNALYLDAPLARIDQYHPWTGDVTAFQVNPPPIVGPWLYPAAFTWYAGTMNSTEHASTVTVDGATMLIAPEEGDGTGEVEIGSNLTLTNAAVGTLSAGVLTFINEAEEFVIQDGAGVAANPGLGNNGTVRKMGVLNTGLFLTLTGSGSYFELQSGSEDVYAMMRNFGGRLSLFENTELWLREIPSVPPPFTQTYSYRQTSGVTILGGNSTLVADYPVQVRGGTLTTQYGGGSSDATIEGTLEVSGGHITIDDSNSPYHHYGTLHVDGNVVWTGGTYHPYVDDAFDWGSSDKWTATGTFTMTAGAGGSRPTLAPSARDGEDNPVMPTSGRHWELFEATGGITNTNNALDYNAAIWGIDVGAGNPVEEWTLRAV